MPKKIIKNSLVKQIGEFGLINLINKGIKTNQFVLKGIGDDAAVINVGHGKCLLITTDTLVENIHFDHNVLPKSIGYKAMACNVSDIAAMGGIPTYAVVSLGVPDSSKVSMIQDIYKGMNQCARKFGVVIVGGDTVKYKSLMISVSLIGEAKKNDIIYRDGAVCGDQIFVSGKIGNSFKTGHHCTFIPRIKESQYLVKHIRPSAMIDISDGLSSDLGHICRSSGVGALLFENNIPLRRQATLKNALNDGEDFELLFTVSKRRAKEVCSKIQMSFHCIGEIVKKNEGIKIQRTNGRIEEIHEKGFQHF